MAPAAERVLVQEPVVVEEDDEKTAMANATLNAEVEQPGQ